jgi:6-phosphogluconolactonase
MSGDLHVFEDAEALAIGAARWLRDKAQAAKGRFAICCSGGSTPQRLYRLLAQQDMPWDRVHWFWGDERFVPHDHPDSNYGTTRRALFDHARVPPQNIHPVPFDGLTPEQSARAYERTLRDYYGAPSLDPARPFFGVTLLGIGGDGHTASLFPGQPALDETRRWAVTVTGARSEDRVTLTYPALDSTQDAIFLAAGREKRAIVAGARAGDRALPAARVKPLGALHWFTDRLAVPA